MSDESTMDGYLVWTRYLVNEQKDAELSRVVGRRRAMRRNQKPPVPGLGERIDQLLIQRNENRREASVNMGFSHAKLNNIIVGETKKPSGEDLETIAAYLGVTYEYLRTGKEGIIEAELPDDDYPARARAIAGMRLSRAVSEEAIAEVVARDYKGGEQLTERDWAEQGAEKQAVTALELASKLGKCGPRAAKAEPLAKDWAEKVRKSIADENACQQDPKCMQRHDAQKICNLFDDRAQFTREMTDERRNPSGVVNKRALYDLGKNIQATEAFIAEAKQSYTKAYKAAFSQAICKK